jgi:creatinine amidohydrolase
MTIRYWREQKTTDFEGFDRENTVVILPLAAIEQHGPHLPLDVDIRINEGLLAESARRAPESPEVLILPTEAIGYSAEHGAFPGTLSHPPESLIAKWVALGEQVAALGFPRLLLFNSHGGNSDPMRIVARELRVACGMYVVGASWYRLARLDDLFDAAELEHGIHGGAVETSVLLHLAPEAVDMSKAANFVSAAAAATERHVSATGPIQFGWASQDLNPSGAVGDATKATEAAGRRIVEQTADRLIELLEEMAAFDLGRLATGEAE